MKKEEVARLGLAIGKLGPAAKERRIKKDPLYFLIDAIVRIVANSVQLVRANGLRNLLWGVRGVIAIG